MNNTTRAEHLAVCKQRALEYVERGDIRSAYASFYSDMEKHPETKDHVALKMGFQLLLLGHLDSPEEMRKFINGFN